MGAMGVRVELTVRLVRVGEGVEAEIGLGHFYAHCLTWVAGLAIVALP